MLTKFGPVFEQRLSKNIRIYRIDERSNCTSHIPFILEADGRLYDHICSRLESPQGAWSKLWRLVTA